MITPSFASPNHGLEQDLVHKEQYEQSRAQGGPVLPQPITTRPVLGTAGRETPTLMWCLRALTELAAAWPLAQVRPCIMFGFSVACLSQLKLHSNCGTWWADALSENTAGSSSSASNSSACLCAAPVQLVRGAATQAKTDAMQQWEAVAALLLGCLTAEPSKQLSAPGLIREVVSAAAAMLAHGPAALCTSQQVRRTAVSRLAAAPHLSQLIQRIVA